MSAETKEVEDEFIRIKKIYYDDIAEIKEIERIRLIKEIAEVEKDKDD